MSDETVRLKESLRNEQLRRFAAEENLNIARHKINEMVDRSEYESIKNDLDNEKKQQRILRQELVIGYHENEKKLKRTITKLKDEVRALRRRNVHK